MTSWLSVTEGVVAAAIPIVGLVYTYTVHKRGEYDRVLTLTEQSGTSPIPTTAIWPAQRSNRYPSTSLAGE